MNGGSRELERERLRALIHTSILTAEVKRNGFGAIDEARFNVALDQIAVDFKFRKRPSASDIFDDAFLPPLDERQVR
jgi:NitT/TauT family transport system substrate-binding protein